MMPDRHCGYKQLARRSTQDKLPIDCHPSGAAAAILARDHGDGGVFGKREYAKRSVAAEAELFPFHCGFVRRSQKSDLIQGSRGVSRRLKLALLPTGGGEEVRISFATVPYRA